MFHFFEKRKVHARNFNTSATFVRLETDPKNGCRHTRFPVALYNAFASGPTPIARGAGSMPVCEILICSKYNHHSLVSYLKQKHNMKPLAVCICLNIWVLGSIFSQSEARLFSVEELKSDFNYLRQKLENKHPNLYAFTPKTAMDAMLESIFQQIKTPATATDFYNLITVLNEKIRDGHTMFLPADAYSPNDSTCFFPFYVDVKGGQVYVSMNCSSDTTIAVGSQILSINGMDAPTMLDFLMARQIRDGFNTAYPHWILDNYFKSYYAFSFGYPDSFALLLRDAHGKEASAHVPALTNDGILAIRESRYPVNRLDSRSGGVELKMDEGKKMALLNLGTFDSRTLRKSKGRSFRRTLKSMFTTIKKQEAAYMILDLRDNQGGDFRTSRLLLKYLIRRPTRHLKRGFESRRISPKRNGFTGKLYVLINGGTFSAASITCSILKAEGRAIFVGEETGGNRVAIFGASKLYSLPNTQLQAYISTKSYHVQHETNDGRGIMPDIEVITLPEDAATGADRPMRFVLELIEREQQR